MVFKVSQSPSHSMIGITFSCFGVVSYMFLPFSVCVLAGRGAGEVFL